LLILRAFFCDGVRDRALHGGLACRMFRLGRLAATRQQRQAQRQSACQTVVHFAVSLARGPVPSRVLLDSERRRDARMDGATLLRTPELSLRWVPVWRRNLLVWRKLAIASVLGNIADPLLYMLALGYGIGAFVPEVGGMKYIAFIGTGMVCQSAMFTSSF